MHELRQQGETVLEGLRELPGGPELLELASRREDVELVGGAARDLLLGHAPRELDVVVACDASLLAHELAVELGISVEQEAAESSRVAVHERFGTALLRWPDGRIDIASRRTESYPAPGALPDVHSGSSEQDLQRRDFTVNAIAVALGGPSRGELSAVPRALEDLAAARLRVLHERSFLDDPTRLLRLARYLARLGFKPEPRTAELAAAALATGALATVSGARIGSELRLALAEPDPAAALAIMGELGILSALHPRLRFPAPLARRALSLSPEDEPAEPLLLGALMLSMTERADEHPQRAAYDLLDEMEFTGPDRDRAIRTATLAPQLVGGLQEARTPSQLSAALHTATPQAVALAGALAEEQQRTEAALNAARWLTELRHIRLQISGDDLLAAGIPAGPEIGQRLDAALARKLDGELIGGREAELNAAMEDL
jgi:tRNA nucleotidyltransferase (CCA-adding enzyme)